jgi:hypothetical protein
MITPPNFLDDILGMFNVLDQVSAWLVFLWKNRNTTEYTMVFNDRYTLNEVIAHLGAHGVKAVRSGFNSRNMCYVISSRQTRLHDLVVKYDKDGAPVLHRTRTRWSGK